MTWLEFAPVLLLAVAVLYVPGLALGLAIGARRFTLWATAPAITVAFVSIAAIVFGRLGIDWSLLTVSAAAGAVAIVAGTARQLVRRRAAKGPAPEPLFTWWTIGSLTVAALIIGVQLVIGFQRPDSISQTFDAFFHLNGIRYIVETGSASSFDIQGLVLPAGQTAFYPAGWHGVTSLVAASADVAIPAAVNAVNLAVAALVWPAGCMLLMRSLLPKSRAAIAAVGVLSAAFPAFPLWMLTFGVLYPYFLGLALLPIALALGFSLGQERVWHRRGLIFRSVLLVIALVAIAFAQPAAAFGWAAITLPLAVFRIVGAVRTQSGWRRAAGWLVLALALIVFAAAWVWFGRIGENTPWPAYTNAFIALFEAVTYGFDGRVIAIVAGVLTIVGVVDLIRRRDKLWFVAGWAMAVLLFVVAAGGPSWRLRALVTGIFYRDPPRLAALLIIVAVPMAVFGALALWRAVQRFVLPRIGVQPATARATVVAAGLLALLVVGTQSAAVWGQLALTARAYTDAEDAPILSGSERALIERIPEHVAEDAVIAGNPWTGAAFAYALTGRHMLNPHFNSYVFPQAPLINEKLNEALDDPAVCEAVREAGVTHVLDFGTYFRDSGETGVRIDGSTPFVGLKDLEEAGVAEAVDREGDAVLYRITACD
ncbi:DUF6541 family protein [Agromyces humatus]|uniref:Uncharacterized protein n=1 Tax=Agromyces humatus TaxID=279573 RepID=A0ABN2K6V6_9MICO|nr:DUF6541 family protein [Agromyces humatus]